MGGEAGKWKYQRPEWSKINSMHVWMWKNEMWNEWSQILFITQIQKNLLKNITSEYAHLY